MSSGVSRLFRLGLLPSLAFAAGLGVARAEQLTIEYDVTLAGLQIGTAKIAAQISGDRYKLDIVARTTGIAGAATGGRGAASSAGGLGGARILPQSYALTAGNSSETRTVRAAFASGNVTAASVEPPLDPKPDRVPVADAHRRGVVDPVSALLMPSTVPGKPLDPRNCNRTISVFDGASRFDVALSYKGARDVAAGDYRGPAIVCAARWNPISGHRPNRKPVKFMMENRDMEVWLAPVGNAPVLAPTRIAVRTMLGMSVIEARQFAVEGTTASVAPKRP